MFDDSETLDPNKIVEKNVAIREPTPIIPSPPQTNEKKEQKEYHTLFVFMLVFNCALGAFYLGYTTSNLNSLQQFLTNALYVDQLDPILLGLVGSLIPIGAMFGAILSGSLANKFGRLKAMHITDAIGILGAILTLVENLPVLLLGRALCGVSVGLNSALVPMFINEVSPIKLNGFTGSMNQVFNCIGGLIALFMAYGVPYTNKDDPSIVANHEYSPFFWRFVFIFPAGLVLLRSLILKFLLPYDTPRYNIMKGKVNEAKIILEKIYTNKQAKTILDKLMIQKDSQSKEGQLKLRDMFNPKYRKRLFVGCALTILQQLSGVNALNAYSNKIFSGGDSSMTPSKYATARDLTMLLGVECLIVPLICSVVSTKIGRRTLLAIGTLICMLSTGIFAVAYAYVEILAKICIFGYAFGYGMSLGPIVWIYIPEILPDVGISIAVLINWLTASIVVQVFPTLPFGSYNFMIFSVFCGIGLIFILTMLKETRGKTPEQIAEAFVPQLPKGEVEIVEIKKADKKYIIPPIIIPKLSDNLKHEKIASPGSAEHLIIDQKATSKDIQFIHKFNNSPLSGQNSEGEEINTRISEIDSPCNCMEDHHSHIPSRFACSKKHEHNDNDNDETLSRGICNDILHNINENSDNKI